MCNVAIIRKEFLLHSDFCNHDRIRYFYGSNILKNWLKKLAASQEYPIAGFHHLPWVGPRSGISFISHAGGGKPRIVNMRMLTFVNNLTFGMVFFNRIYTTGIDNSG